MAARLGMGRLSARSWGLIALAALTLPIAIPIAVVLAGGLTPAADIWQHIKTYLLTDLLLNSVILGLGVAALSLVFGVSMAALTCLCQFPGRRWFSWALMLPLAFPPYVLGFVHIGLWDYTGPIQTWLRQTAGPLSLPQIRSTGGLIVVLSLALYPYIYLLARSAFRSQGVRLLEVGQSLGLNRWQAFWQILLPSARPWLAAGCLLVLMETLADFGTVTLFNVDTFTTAIYKAWFSLFSLPTAQTLAAVLGSFLLLLLLLEPWLQGKRHYTNQRPQAALTPAILSRWQAGFAWLACCLLLLLAVILPLTQLLQWSWIGGWAAIDARFLAFIGHSLLLGILASILVTLLALLLALAQRHTPGKSALLLSRVATLGYAIPGSVLAVGIFVPLASLDNWLADYLNIELMLRSSLAALLLAYVARFLAVGVQPIQASLNRITANLDEAAASLGCTGWRRITRLYLPLLGSGLSASALLVAVDVMKEMPITLMMRPFGWESLSIRIFELTSEGQWEQAALPALALVVIGLLPVMLLIRTSNRN